MRDRHYVILGGAGYIARRHVKVIHDLGGVVDGVVDPCDSVGYLNSLFPRAAYFRSIEEAGSWIVDQCEKPIIVVCTPNYLHVAHCVFGWMYGCPVIVEKPVSIDYDGYQKLGGLGVEVYPVLQLRNSEVVRNIRNEVVCGDEFVVNYFAQRGAWYDSTWKNDESKSGGLIFNIGVHAIDLICFLFGRVRRVSLLRKNSDCVSFEYGCESGRVELNLGLTENRREVVIGSCVYSIDINDELHRVVHEQVVSGGAIRLGDICETMKICDVTRSMWQKGKIKQDR